MKIIGLCGGSGSGKGAVSEIFLKCGIPAIDTDAIYHELTSYNSVCLQELVSAFGEEILDGDSLDRKRLSSIVFGNNSSGLLEMLNRISHHHILSETKRRLSQLESAGYSAVLVDAPLLFESGFDRECDIIVSVLAEEELRIQRIIARDNITIENARRRIASQHSDSWLAEHSDFIIQNNGDMEELEKSVASIVNEILK